ncbi:MAG: DUF1929 domain-containing protein [Bdellovibrionales bacterium]|nr:DUF1929 domain-containing protein [Bdellovibrionales bacterium]
MFDTVALGKGKDPWSVHVNHEAASDAMNIGPFDYPHTYLLYKPVIQNGRPYHVATWGGQNGKIALLSLDPKVPENEKMIVRPNGKRPNANGSADKTSLLLPSGEILVAGGGSRGDQEGQRIDIYDPYEDKWRSINTGITRIRPASTILPDGNVLILNGEGMWDGGGPTVGDRKQVTLFDPTNNKAFNLGAWADDPADRGYHNISLLLKDGSLLVGGGRTLWKANNVEEYRIGCERPDLRIFKPPYLFWGPQAEILDLPDGTSIPLGGKEVSFRFSNIKKLRGQSAVALIALGSETHHFDQNQRYVPLEYAVKGDVVTIKSPKNSIIAPEGEYLLFLISDAGVPSVARTVKVGL